MTKYLFPNFNTFKKKQNRISLPTMYLLMSNTHGSGLGKLTIVKGGSG